MEDYNKYEKERQAARIAGLIAASLMGELSEKQGKELEDWKNLSSLNNDLYLILRRPGELVKNLKTYAGYDTRSSLVRLKKRLINQQVLPHPVNRTRLKKLTWFFSTAAVLAIVLTTGLYFYQKTAGRAEVAVYPAVKVKLLFSDGKDISLEDERSGLISSDRGLAYGDGSHIARTPLQKSKLTLQVPRGKRYQLSLSDGTRVWLNSGSSLVFPSQFQKGIRTVELHGEAYFKVAHDAHRPFIVTSGAQSTTVLGTEFNIFAYTNEEVKTTLIRGSVKVITLKNDELTLNPGEQSVLSIRQALKRKTVHTDDEIAWKNDAISFNGKSFVAIMNEVSRSYDVQVRYQGSPPVLQLYGSINKGTSLAPILAVLKANEISFTLKDNILWIDAVYPFLE